MSADWTPERVERLSQMLANGTSPFEVATRLGGLSENDVVQKAVELSINLPVYLPTEIMDELIDELVKEIDYDAWKLSYNPDTAEGPEFVEDARNSLKAIIFAHGA